MDLVEVVEVDGLFEVNRIRKDGKRLNVVCVKTELEAYKKAFNTAHWDLTCLTSYVSDVYGDSDCEDESNE